MEEPASVVLEDLIPFPDMDRMDWNGKLAFSLRATQHQPQVHAMQTDSKRLSYSTNVAIERP